MDLNAAKRRMREGKPAIGGVCFAGSPLIAQRVALAGCDFVLIDNQHGVWDKDRCMAALHGAWLGNAIPMARVEQNDFYAIGSLLDQGALGIVVPMVNTRQDAEAATFATYYPPKGGRSLGAMGAAFYGLSDPQLVNEEIFLAVQIETALGVENAEEILSVDGIDGCWIGPADLARSLGVDLSTPQGRKLHEENIHKVLAACRTTEKIAGIAELSPDPQRRIDEGFRFITVVYDLSLIQDQTRRVLEGLRPDG
jgi:4-hydroxy-2-oxoheptanedioate aldolase